MREADITESGAVNGGRSISNLRYADGTAPCGKYPQEINNIVHKEVSIDVDGETIDKVNSFTYLGAINTSTGSCSEDIKARIGRAKKATMELDIIWKIDEFEKNSR